MLKKPQTVYLALSGGVDSAVSAYLLKAQGYRVKAVFMKNWTGTAESLAGECNWVRERDDAQAVARKLKIPFAVWDFEREYRSLVIDHFFKEYERGRTPNPDVRCNQFVKIPLFLQRALKEGADLIATGHYARVRKSPTGSYQLLSGLDLNKDQSYFLYTLTQNQLKHLLFPVGELSKPEVRKLAKRVKLPVAEKPDSVGICFIGEVRVEDFLRTRIRETPGPIVNTRGKVLGQHRGLPFYTVGQRHGLGLSGGPWYVVGRRWKRNTLIVGTQAQQRHLLARTFVANQATWISGKAPKLPATFLVGHRYRHPVVPARVIKRGRNLQVTFVKNQRAITPGQSAVLYRKTRGGLEVVGGAVIDKIKKQGFEW
jgi:tRNA-specific 2-thiouridylase